MGSTTVFTGRSLHYDYLGPPTCIPRRGPRRVAKSSHPACRTITRPDPKVPETCTSCRPCSGVFVPRALCRALDLHKTPQCRQAAGRDSQRAEYSTVSNGRHPWQPPHSILHTADPASCLGRCSRQPYAGFILSRRDCPPHHTRVDGRCPRSICSAPGECRMTVSCIDTQWDANGSHQSVFVSRYCGLRRQARRRVSTRVPAVRRESLAAARHRYCLRRGGSHRSCMRRASRKRPPASGRERVVGMLITLVAAPRKPTADVVAQCVGRTCRRRRPHGAASDRSPRGPTDNVSRETIADRPLVSRETHPGPPRLEGSTQFGPPHQPCVRAGRSISCSVCSQRVSLELCVLCAKAARADRWRLLSTPHRGLLRATTLEMARYHRTAPSPQVLVGDRASCTKGPSTSRHPRADLRQTAELWPHTTSTVASDPTA